MTETPTLPAVGRLPTGPASNADGSRVYAPRRGTQLRYGLVFLGVGLFGLFPSKGILDWLSGGPLPNAQTFLALVFLLILPICGFAILALNTIRGLPRLTIGPQGAILETMFGRRWAYWDSIEPFAIKTVYAGRSRNPVLTASANVVGPNASNSSFYVPDLFQTPIDTIVDDLNAARARTVGVADTSPMTEPDEASIGLVDFKLPWLTFALLAVLIAVFALETSLAVAPGPDLNPGLLTLSAMGALNPKAVLSAGQWYRLFTAPLLHANVPHILGNGVALLMGGWILERVVGRLWLFALYVVSALGGALVSLAVLSPNIVSVGASGAIMGLFAALCVSSFRLASGTPERTRMQINSARVLVPSLLPLFSTSGIHVDYGAHFGGAITGAVVTAVLLNNWPKTARIPQLRMVAGGISIVGSLLIVASIGMVIANYPIYRAAGARPLPAIIPRIFPSQSPTRQETPSDVLMDHGPGRVACDLQWSKSPERSNPDRYADFLRNCMRK